MGVCNARNESSRPAMVRLLLCACDHRLAIYKSEPQLIDAALEVVNATTDLIEE